MEIYPAVDLYQGKVVRLERGDYQKCKVYSDHPSEIVKRWVEAGARWIHIVDLEGARDGEIKNWPALEKILSHKKVKIQFGGGVRRESDVERLLQAGVERVVLGSKILDPAFLKRVCEGHGSQLALSLDFRGEEIQVEGWMRPGGKKVEEVFEELRPYRIQRLIVTDIERDGTLTGINLEKINHLLEKSPFPIILSGGVASLEDIRALAATPSPRLDGVIVGKALYENRLDLKKGLQAARGKEN